VTEPARLLATFEGVPWAHGAVEAWLGPDAPTELPVTSACALVTRGTRLLLVEVRSRGWDLPGGHVDPGEDGDQALLRELHEEAGLAPASITVPAPLGWFRLPHSIMLVRAAELIDVHEPLRTTVPDEIGDVRLFDLGDLPPGTDDRIWLPFRASLPHR